MNTTNEKLKTPSKIINMPAKEIDPQKQMATDSIYPLQGVGDLGNHKLKSKRIDISLGKHSLTEKQDKVLSFVKDHVKKLGFPPTIRDIAEYFSISVKASHDHLKAIAKKGYMKLFPGVARGIELMQPYESEGISSYEEMMHSVQLVPLLGSIAAGKPILAHENIDTHLAFPKSFLPKTGNMFALKIKGESMEGAGILDGDIAVLKQFNESISDIKNGDIVAALIDGEATLKTFMKINQSIELKAENPKFAPIVLNDKQDLLILGILVGVYRKY